MLIDLREIKKLKNINCLLLGIQQLFIWTRTIGEHVHRGGACPDMRVSQ